MRELQIGETWTDAVIRAAAALYDTGAKAVWLFGSRARNQTAGHLSDIDLAVEGLPDGTEVIKRLVRELPRRVDIVRLESATPDMRWAIMRDRVYVPCISSTGANAALRAPLPKSLAGERTYAVAERIREIVPKSVIDFGCGEGWLLSELAADDQYTRLTGVDFDADALVSARGRIARASGPGWNKKVELLHGLVTHRNSTFLGHDVASAIEVIEHLEPPQLKAFVRVVFEFVRPDCVIITTPNREYNVLWVMRRPLGFRHPDHRFEWSRAEFTEWVREVAISHGYQPCVESVGPVHPVYGAPTQLAVFVRRDIPHRAARSGDV